MIKLVDYFVVVGYDDSECNNNSNRHKAKGKIVQRFPIGPTLTTNNNNTDVTDQQHQILEEFDANIHCFCQPDKGWRLYTKQEPPTFFVSVLTDIKGQHRYCACLTFLEPYTPSKQKSILNNENNNINGNNCNYKHHHNLDSTDEDIKDDSNTVYIEYLNDDFSHANIKTTLLLKQQPNNSHKNNESTRQQQQPIEPSKLYVAKSLVLISRLEYIDLFKSCLSLIYAVYVDKRHSTDNKLLEIIISNLLTLQVNAPGTALGTTFSLGADDKHIVQATASLTVPSTGASVYKLFKEIGIVNVFKLVLAILADFKILFFSRSYTKLYDACRAIESLLFPLKYTGVYVPVLPCFGSFLEFPAAPTPYIIGVHSSFRRLIEEMHSDCLQECLKVDLDGANVWIPQCVDDLIGGNFNSSNTHQSSNSNTNSSTGTNTTSGISMMTGSSSSAYSESYSNENNNNNSNSNKTFGLPNYLYESTLNLLYSILKPDVLRADELVEFSQKSNTSNVSSMWSMSSGIVSSSSTSSLDQKQHQNQQHENDQLLFVSQLNSNTAAQMLVAAAANDLQTVNNTKSGDLISASSSTSSTSSFNTNHSIRSSVMNLNNNNNSNNNNNLINESASSSSISSSSSSSLLTTNVNQMSSKEIESVWTDKLLRAVFVRLFAQLFAGFRYCLLVIRINPKPVICFNKAAFLGNHCLNENEFMNRLLDSMSFQRFIEERGPSYRHCDVFDDLYADIQSQLKDELEQQLDTNFNPSKSLVIKHLKQIAEKLYKYEFPQTSVLTSFNLNSTNTNNLNKLLVNQQQHHLQSKLNNKDLNSSNGNLKMNSNGLLTTPNRSFSKIKLPTLDAYKRIHSEMFPQLDANEIQRLINLNCSNSINNNSSISETLSYSSSSNLNTPRNHLCRPHLVPYGPPVETVKNMSAINKCLVTLAENNYNLNEIHSNLTNLNHIHNNNNSQTTTTTDWNHESVSCVRKLEAISQCVSHIFDNNFKEAKKNLNSAYRALRDPRARLHLCNCLQKYVKKNQVILNNEQFEYICKLLNESLANDTRLDESGVAFSILPLTSAFYRKLNNGTVDQCIYTRLQQHSVWSNMQFWEMSFYSDVQRNIRPVYLSNEEFAAEQEKENCTTTSSNSGKNSSRASLLLNDELLPESAASEQKQLIETKFEKLNVNNQHLDDLYDEVESKIVKNSNKLLRPDNLNLNINHKQTKQQQEEKIFLPELNLNLYLRPAEKTALEICGEQMEKYAYLTPEQRDNYIRNEQGIIRSHVLHYITQMVNMLIPLDINKENEKSKKESSKLESPNNQSSEPTTPHSQSFNEEFGVNSNEQTTKFNNNNKRHSNITAASNNNHGGINDTESLNNNDMIGVENLSISASDGDSGLPSILPGENLDSIAQVSFKRENNQNMYSSYDVDEAGYSVWKFVSKFVDHVCIEGNLNDSQRQSLHHNLSEVISMQIQMLDTVYKESKRIPLRTKPKFDILKPDFIFSGEHFIDPTPLRCHLVPDGREETNGLSGGTVILPAEGALFLTNYRIIYRGFPINDSLMSDAIITRSFPISALIKEKKIGNQFKLGGGAGANTNSILSNSLTTLNNPGTYEMASLHDGIQMRSSTFQLIKVFFDEEVSTEKIEKFRHSLLKLRYPQSVLEFFCFSQNNTKYPYCSSNGTFNLMQNNGFKNYAGLSKETSVNNIGNSQSEFYPHTLNIKTKEKGTDALRNLAKSTLRKAGLMPRNSNRKIPNANQPHLSTIASRTPETIRKSNRSQNSSIYHDSINDYQKSSNIQIDSDEENLSVIEENFDNFNGNTITGCNTITPNSYKVLEKWLENSLAYKDYIRQGLITLNHSKDNKIDDTTSASLIRNDADQENEFLNLLTSSTSDSLSSFRICTLNSSYQLCKSYPALFIVSKETTDDCIRKNSKCHRQNRLPIIVWQHPVNKSLLLRSSGFHGKGFIGMLMKGQTTNNSNENNTNLEQDKYINQIVKLTRLFSSNLLNEGTNNNAANATVTNNNNNLANMNSSTLNNPLSSSFTAYNYSATPSVYRRNVFPNKIEKSGLKTTYNVNSNTSNPSVSSLSSSSENGTGNVHQKVVFNQIQHPNHQNINKFNTIASLSSSSNSHSTNPALHQFKSKVDFDTNSSSQADVLNESFSNSINSSSNLKRGSTLYIICEKSQIKSLKSSELSKDSTQISFIPVDIHEVRDAKNSFKKLCKACVPSAISNETNSESNHHHHYHHHSNGGTKSNGKSSSNFRYSVSRSSQKNKSTSRFSNASNSDQFSTTINYNNLNQSANLAAGSSTTNNGFYKQLNESKWFEQLQTIINVSNLIVDRLEELSSVIVALEDGWDFTTQVTSLAELFLDPYYRTIEGFSVLVEREWLSMGHRFSRRNNHTVDDQTGFAPLFIQFLDIVHQCVNQYPNAFEFNEFYLEFLAYHSVSNRFKTFLLDNEFERFNFGLLTVNQSNITPANNNKKCNNETNGDTQYLHTNVSHATSASISANTTCIWQYIQKVHYNSAKFFNFNYQPNIWHSLRPSSSLYKLKLWRYFTKETLCTGPVYDLDLLTIGNLNYNPINKATTMVSNSIKGGEANDEFWYPVPIKNANDYYEQLDQILPSQYEILLKQIMRKYNLTCTSLPQTNIPTATTASIYTSSSSSVSSNPTSQLLSNILSNTQLNSNLCNNLASQNIPLNWKCVWDYFYQTVESKIIKDYMSNSENVKEISMINKVNYTTSQRQLSTPSSSSMIPPPFPVIKQSNPHEFEEFIFSSGYLCCHCGGSFKSTTQFIGYKCKTCTMSFHEECVQNPNFHNECNFISNGSEWNVNNFPQQQQNFLTCIPQLEISSYSMQTTSSCSTSPNSYFSQNNNINNNRPKYFNSGKLDSDIGSVCAAGLTNNNGYGSNISPNSYGNSVSLKANSKNQHYLNSPVNDDENGGKNFVNWSGLPNNENQTYAGYLKKQGALFKQWKERYFVLDSCKHQLRYYDSTSDSTIKGIIDLSDVEQINQGLSSSYLLQNQQQQQVSTTKKALNTIMSMNGNNSISDTEAKNCFELKTSKRVYYFCAKSQQDAYKWVKQLQMCCLDS